MILFISYVFLFLIVSCWLLLLINKPTIIKIATYIFNNSDLSSDEQLKNFYIANAGYYICKYKFNAFISISIFLLSFSIPLLIIFAGLQFAFNNYISMVIFIFIDIIIIFSNIITFYSPGKTSKSRLKLLTIRYYDKNKEEFHFMEKIGDIKKIILYWDKESEELTKNYFYKQK